MRSPMTTMAAARSRPEVASASASRAATGLHPIPKRILEVLPPALAWVAITSPAWAAIVAPQVLGGFLVAFSGYWLWRSIEFAVGLLIGLARLHVSQRRDWLAAGERLDGYGRVHHVVIVPTYRESDAVLSETLDCLTAQTLPLERIAVVLAFEERDPDALARAERLSAQYADRFGEWLTTLHPDLAGEVKGKSSNLAWAARRIEDELIANRRLDVRNLLVTVCDADSRFDRQYLAALGQHVLSHPHGRLHIYQPAILFYANHGRLPLPLRAVSSVFSLYSLARLAASHRLIPQSTYSLSWWAARRVSFWDVDVVPEDSHMFFKVWLHLGKRVRTRAIHLPVYADAAEGLTPIGSAASTYNQIRRWAWGVSDIPYLLLRTIRARHIPWHVRVARVGWYVEEHLVWPSHWFLLTLGGMLPPLLNPEYARTAAGIWQSSVYSTLLGLCLPSLVLAIIADALLQWRTDGEWDLLSVVLGIVGFALLPLTGLALVALPALDAHTRLLFGRSLAYQVTEKVPRSTPAGNAFARAMAPYN
jgi:Glycosyl transferase family group 2